MSINGKVQDGSMEIDAGNNLETFKTGSGSEEAVEVHDFQIVSTSKPCLSVTCSSAGLCPDFSALVGLRFQPPTIRTNIPALLPCFPSETGGVLQGKASECLLGVGGARPHSRGSSITESQNVRGWEGPLWVI